MSSPSAVEERLNKRPFTVNVTGKLQDHHLDRLAIVYVRQSTAHQVLENTECETQAELFTDVVKIAAPESGYCAHTHCGVDQNGTGCDCFVLLAAHVPP